MDGTRRYRVDELAAEAAVSVEVIRSYQSRGLLPPPEHEGRVAWYDERHLDRLHRIRDLKDNGWPLRSIAAALDDAGPELRSVIEDAVDRPEELLDLATLAERTGVPVAVLRSFEASGVLRPRHDADGRRSFTTADVNAVRALLALLGTGVPMEEFMAVADVQLTAVTTVATGTFELFLRYLREPLLAREVAPDVEAERMAGALRLLLQSVGTLLTYNFQRTILDVAQQFIAEQGTEEERAALAREVRRHFELVPLPEGV
ncbi:MAG: MerR family transcriptional regulator [Actinomycetota bacterium]|nr:MerR family transcriptional regulator [Acidimicrobiia bacterium]MDQ3293961.1 MerR family transcriptional regulator [Actinomycetota bacterium]